MITPLGTMPSPKPEIHGHRGCRGLLPENTLPAFLKALALGVDVLELDVVISHDKQVVVSHEPWLTARLGTGPLGEEIAPATEQKFNLYQMPYATIQQCLVGAKPHPGFPAQQQVISYRPLLREVLAIVEAACQQMDRPPVGYSVEIKSSPSGDDIFHPAPEAFVELVLAELRVAAVHPRTTLLSFDPRILQIARRLAPAQSLCLLSETLTPTATLFAQLGFVPDTFGPDFTLLSSQMVRQLANDYPALRLVPWTVNEPRDMTQAISWGVTGITTDFPDRLMAFLSH
jgi:glycerophosphoryl diester phosphodiesterase